MRVDDRELVERAGRGDRDAFSTLLRARLARLDAAARLILRDPDLAADAVQDACLLAWRDLPGLRDPDRFDAWLHRLGVRSCLITLRRRRRRVIEVELTSEEGPPIAGVDVTVARRDEVDRALARLTVDARSVVVVHFFLGLPLTEVAEMLDIPVGTAKSRLHRALEVMRVELGGDPASAEPSVAPGASA